jgi:hypothetical protein
MRWILQLSPVFLLVACGTAQHSVKVEDERAFHQDTKVEVGEVSNRTGETFDIDVEGMLRTAMNNALTEENLHSDPGSQNSIIMDLNIIEYRKGDAFKRWLWPGFGSTVLVIEANLLDADGNVDATAQANRSVDAGGGYTIGAWREIFNDVAADLVSDLTSKVTSKPTSSAERGQ